MAETQKLTDTQTTDVRYASPLFSPDGKTIASVSARRSADKTREPESGIAVFQGGSLKMILKSGSLRLVGWSNSGTDLILQNSSGPMKAGPIDFDLEMVSMKGGSQTIATLTDVHADTMTLSPDRLSVAFVARRSDKDDIWVLILKSRETRKITNNGNTRTFYSSLEWSPTGKTIFFDKQEQVNTISMFENFN